MVKLASRAREISSPPTVLLGGLTVLGARRVDDCLNAQAELVKAVDGINRRWLGRMQSERALASEFAAKMAAARTLPDAMAACRQWSRRRLALMAEDGRHVLDALMRTAEAPAKRRGR